MWVHLQKHHSKVTLGNTTVLSLLDSSQIMSFPFRLRNNKAQWMLLCCWVSPHDYWEQKDFKSASVWCYFTSGFTHCSCLILLSFLTSEDIILCRDRVRNREIKASALCGCIVFFWACWGMVLSHVIFECDDGCISVCYAEISGGRELRGNHLRNA